MATFTKNQDYNDIKKDARNLGNDVKDAANSTVAKVIGMNTQDVKDMAHEAGQNVRQFIDDTSKQAVDARDRLEERVVSNPLTSVAVAAVGGFILGALLRR
ncbi:MAG: hypothetical protein V4691_00240 [Pseudomonadota bacterium]